MDYTAGELAAISASVLDFHIKKAVKDNVLYAKPTMKKMVAKRKEYDAAKELITMPVRFSHDGGGVNDDLEGIGPHDKLKFTKLNNDRRVEAKPRKMHIGITMSEDELETAGITVVDEFGRTSGGSTDPHPVLINMIMSKADQFNELYDERFNRLLWSDGTAKPNALAGLLSIILDDPTQGTVCGFSGALTTAWRNRAYTAAHAASGGAGAITSNVANGGELIQVLKKDNRQLMRFGSKIDMRPAGSDFLDALEREIRANGGYSDSGFSKDHDVDIGGVRLGGSEFYYEPELDNIGRAKFSYAWDSRDIHLYAQKGLWKKIRKPARPYDEFVIHQSLVSKCNLITDKRNGSAVYQIT